jgi:signal peptidase I
VELKRVIGQPGEEITWGRGRFQVNGFLLDEPYARIPPAPPGDDEVRAVLLGPNEYFMAGDNRLYSHDSRQYGPLSRRAILGKILPVRL